MNELTLLHARFWGLWSLHETWSFHETIHYFVSETYVTIFIFILGGAFGGKLSQFNRCLWPALVASYKYCKVLEYSPLFASMLYLLQAEKTSEVHFDQKRRHDYDWEKTPCTLQISGKKYLFCFVESYGLRSYEFGKSVDTKFVRRKIKKQITFK